VSRFLIVMLCVIVLNEVVLNVIMLSIVPLPLSVSLTWSNIGRQGYRTALLE